jgi:uncharacterized membrane protein
MEGLYVPKEYGWIVLGVIFLHFLFGLMVSSIMSDKGYKGTIGYYCLGLFFGILGLLIAIGMPISREEQAERDKAFIQAFLDAQEQRSVKSTQEK